MVVEIGINSGTNSRGPSVILMSIKKGPNMHDTAGFSGLDAPILDERPWAVFSACRDADPGIFFAARRADERSALALCSICTVDAACLEFALETEERFGVWGGTNERERKGMLSG